MNTKQTPNYNQEGTDSFSLSFCLQVFEDVNNRGSIRVIGYKCI